jgi:glycosyltransferase involved in cell wall biosynthesis
VKTEVYILCYNEHEILPYTLRHYQTFCDKVVLLDLGSTDNSREIAVEAGCEVRPVECKDELNDALNKKLKEECWRGTDADWVIVVDCDELVYFPEGAIQSLTSYDLQELPVIKPHGFEMFSDSYPTTDKQIYDEVQMGASEDFWYAKPILFSPKRVASIEFSVGAHWCKATLPTKQVVPLLQENPVFSDPPGYLLHFHHLGGVERIGKRYDFIAKRLSPMNRKMNWGNQKPGVVHAQEKRNYILPKLRRVIS